VERREKRPLTLREDVVCAASSEHFDESVRLFVGDRAIEIVDAVTSDGVRDPLFGGFLLVEPDAGDFRIREGRPRIAR
jgi:hypothetical protein